MESTGASSADVAGRRRVGPQRRLGTSHFPTLMKRGDPRLSFVQLLGGKPDALNLEYRAQLAGLSSSSGYPLCSEAHASSSRSTAAPHTRTKGDNNGKAKGKAMDEDQNDAIDGGSSSEIEIVDALPLCTKKRCESNPNCLRFLGQDKWSNRGQSYSCQHATGHGSRRFLPHRHSAKAKEEFLKTDLLGPNPMEASRVPGVPCGLKVRAREVAAALEEPC